ncbi:hypothetical protein [Ramlibacter sp.]|uniref:hypothetical protein n=1 Tax=Ramlibacter sp. TaxID=1917967 RepID=UPI002C397BF4|nr:hypothetical protein [Ramlibacter sp.]HWI82961.1 hypothetical protein [Ramlibacter sp.]
MADPLRHTLTRRHVLIGAAASALPWRTQAMPVLTPHELARHYRLAVVQRLQVPAVDVRLYGAIADMQLLNERQPLLEPQYVLLVDRNPHVQAAFLFWRLLPGSYALIGASPVSTRRARDGVEAAGLLERAGILDGQGVCATRCIEAARGVYDFAWERAGGGSARVQLRGAGREAEGRLGRPCTDDCILVPATLIAFLDEYGVLDAGDAAPARQPRALLPYRGRHLLLIDSGRDDRPEWSPAPAA